MPVATREPDEQDRISRIEGMLEAYMAQHAKLHEETLALLNRLHEDTLALVTRVEERSNELGERLATEQRELTSALASIEGEVRAWRGAFVGLVAIVAAFVGALLSPLFATILSRGG